MRFIMSFAVAGLLGSAGLAQQAADAVDPEQAVADSGFAAMSAPVGEALAAKVAGKPVMADTWMVAAANPHAVEAGAEVLRAGARRRTP